MQPRSALPIRFNRPAAVVAFAAGLALACAPAAAAITNSAVASGTFRGAAVQSDAAELALQVQPASPGLALGVETAFEADDIAGKSVGDAVGFTISVRNSGDVGIAGVAVTLALEQGSESFAIGAPPRLVGGDEINPGVLDRGETWTFEARYPVALANLEIPDDIEARAAASGLGTGIPVTGRASAAVRLPPLQDIAPGLISLAHVPATYHADAGDPVGYAITISNRSPKALSARLTGVLDEGIGLSAGTVVIGGKLSEPAAEDSMLDFGVIEIAAADTVTVNYSGVVREAAVRGFHVNTASIIDPATGIALIPPSRATLQTGSAPQSGCTGISIRVYDDENRDGAAEPEEEGLSGVRVAAEGADPLTTDPSGEFFSPCVTVSRLAGIDLRFTLDEATLPPGYYLTSQNPVSLRVERGDTGAVAFGAAAARIVRIDLNAAAFLRNSVVPDTEMADGITRLISVLGREPSIVRLTYYAHREAADLAEKRLAAIRETIQSRWAASDGGYDLQIEDRIVQSGG